MGILKGGSYVGGDFTVANNLIAGGTLTSNGNIYTNGSVYTNGKVNTGDQDLRNLSTCDYVNSTFLKLAGGTMTGPLVLSPGVSGGLKFPDNSFGGGGDTATMTLVNPGGSEATEMTFTMTNDADDIVNFSIPSINGVKVNHNTVWNAGNAGTTDYDWNVRALNTASIITMPTSQQIRWGDNTSMIYGTSGNLNLTGVATFSSNINAAGYGNFGTTRANAYIKFNGINAIAGYDAWLRINDGDGFTTGIYCGNTILRTDGELQVGGSGDRFKVGTNGNTILAHSTANSGARLQVYGSSQTTFEAAQFYNTYGYDGVNKCETRISLGKLEAGTTYQPMGAIGASPTSNGNSGDGYLSFYTRTAQSLTEKMRLLSNGNLLLGTITDSGYKLDVRGATYSNAIMVGNNGAAGTPGILLAIGDTDTGLHSTSDGTLLMYANNVSIGNWNSSAFSIGVTTYLNSDTYLGGNIHLNNERYIKGKDTSGTYYQLFGVDGNNYVKYGDVGLESIFKGSGILMSTASKTNIIAIYDKVFLNANTEITGTITATNVIKSGSSDSYFLLGGGGHVTTATYALSSDVGSIATVLDKINGTVI